MERVKLKGRLVRKPQSNAYLKYPKKLDKRENSIIDLKLHYKKKFTPLRVNYILPLEHDLNVHWNPLLRVLEQYLDILITPYEYISTKDQRVRKTIAVIGSREQIPNAVNVLNELYFLIFKSLERKKRRLRLQNRQARRRNRRYRKQQRIIDSRVRLSRYRIKLFSFLEEEIRKRTQAINTDRKIKIKGSLRRKRIKSYIWGKYKKIWKKRVR